MDTNAYEQTIDFLYHQLPMYQHQGSKAIKKDLTNIKALLSALGNPQNNYRVIHIAGTNGKGTVAHLTASVLTASEYTVGLYTSPHYVDFRERIKIDGKWIRKEFVVRFVNEHQELIASIRPSFFEITVAMAFSYFSQSNVDVAVIETGLGGRLDSTNVVSPILTAITNISLDHVHTLGPDLYTIAGEKAGIIKPNIPVVIGRHQVACDQVFWYTAKLMVAPISFASIQWSFDKDGDQYCFVRKNKALPVILNIPEGGPFLIENIVTVLELVYQGMRYKLLDINKEAIREGITNFKRISGYIGRWQVISTQPHIIADSAHNLQALEAVIQHFNQKKIDRIHFIMGFVKEKDLDPILSLFPKNYTYYFTRPSIERGLSPDVLYAKAHEIGLTGNIFPTVKDAFFAAKNNYSSGDLIYVGGSSFVVGDFLAFRNEHED